jgi:hypothetical protein
LDPELLLGTWNIISWEQRYDDGRVTYPLGKALDGFIAYDRHGRMSCMMAKADMVPFESGGQWNASEAERARAYSSFMSYAGRYSINGDVVTHHVEISLFPNWKNNQQKRRVKLLRDHAGDMLEIIARLEDGTSEARSAVLTWKRRHD